MFHRLSFNNWESDDKSIYIGGNGKMIGMKDKNIS